MLQAPGPKPNPQAFRTMFNVIRDSLDQCFATVTCTDARRRVPIKVWYLTIVLFTILTTMFMLVCVCTDQWEVTTYNYHHLLNLTSEPRRGQSSCSYTELTPVERTLDSWLLTTYGPVNPQDKSSSSCDDTQVKNISLVFTQYGSAFRLCLDIEEDIWPNISQLCKPATLDRCLVYDTISVKTPFCCVKCLYSPEEVDDMDDQGGTSFEPIFTVMGFLMVSLIILCVCHVLALIAFWKRVIPVVLITGILFLVSGTFMAFCLAAHQYKVEIMNTRGRTLPHMTPEMMASSKTVLGWSIDVGWMGFIFSVLTGVLWIRFSYFLASETSVNKIRPTVTILNHSNSLIPTTPAPPLSPHPLTPANGGMGVPKTVRWASSSNGSQPATGSTMVSNSRPNSGSNLLTNEPTTNGGAAVMNGNVGSGNKHPMMVEDSV